MWPQDIGFTGTRNGMTPKQREALRRLLRQGRVEGWIQRFHHGDCTGADAQAHELAHELGYRIVLHPPLSSRERAFCTGHEIRKAKRYLDRDQDIVDESEVLLACPKTPNEELRSGTWATVRRGWKKNRHMVAVLSPWGSAAF